MEVIVTPDLEFENMYRIQWEDGIFSENFYNKTRAHEFARRLNSGEISPQIENEGLDSK